LSCAAPRTLHGNYCVECCTSDDEVTPECCQCNPDTGYYIIFLGLCYVVLLIVELVLLGI
jgi:hypothetical protein